MKRKFGILLFSCLLALLLTSCGEVLSVVTAGKDGEKVVNAYVSLFSDKVYDKTVTLKSWKDISIFNGDEFEDFKNNPLFEIENKKEKIVVAGNELVAIEISFFDGGYMYTLFSSTKN